MIEQIPVLDVNCAPKGYSAVAVYGVTKHACNMCEWKPECDEALAKGRITNPNHKCNGFERADGVEVFFTLNLRESKRCLDITDL